MKKLLLLLFLMMPHMVISAHDIEVKNADGVTIYYNYTSEGTELEVTFCSSSSDPYSNDYAGNIVIPDEVVFMNKTRKVTSVGQRAFYGCSSLTSIILPSNVTSIGEYAFYLCSSLTTISIPNSVTSIDCGAFQYCSGLKSVTIPNNVKSIGNAAFNACSSLASVTIGNSVTSIGSHAFYDCSSLTSISIPNSVTSIGKRAFYGCSGLASVTIGNGVTSIGEYAFYGCSGFTSITIPDGVTSIDDYVFYLCSSLTSITIPNNVRSIGSHAFYGCSSLTSVTFPDNVVSIGYEAFHYCRSLTSVTIPNSVTSIGCGAFSDCSGLTSVTIGNSVMSIGGNAFEGVDMPIVTSLIEDPFSIEDKTSVNKTFSLNTFNNATLYVPTGTIDKYKATEGWKDFVFIEEGSAPPTPPTPPAGEKCEKPTIGYSNGKLIFASSTEGAICYYTITDSDIKSGSGSEVQLGVTYNIRVYAAKSGYNNSDVATATLCWIDATPQTEGIIDGVAQIAARPVLVKTDNGFITVEGVDDRTDIAVYTVSGQEVGSTKANGTQASLATNIKKGEVAIIKIGEKSVKVVMQ